MLIHRFRVRVIIRDRIIAYQMQFRFSFVVNFRFRIRKSIRVRLNLGLGLELAPVKWKLGIVLRLVLELPAELAHWQCQQNTRLQSDRKFPGFWLAIQQAPIYLLQPLCSQRQFSSSVYTKLTRGRYVDNFYSTKYNGEIYLVVTYTTQHEHECAPTRI